MAKSKKPSLKAETLKLTGWSESGVVRLVDDGDEVDERSIMNVFQCALITTTARVGLLLAIRKSCPNPSQDFIYCDTDSINAFTEYPNQTR